MKVDIRTNTKDINNGDVFFCSRNAEQYLDIFSIRKASKVFCERGFFARLNEGNSTYSAKQDLLNEIDRSNNCSNNMSQTKKRKIFEIDNFHDELVSQLQQRYKIPKKVIAATGTKGKTSTCWFIFQILNFCGINTGYVGTIGAYYYINNEINKISKNITLTTPAIDDLYRYLDEMYKNGSECVVFEASSHALIQGRMDGLHVDCGCFTNFSQDHLDFHKSLEEYLHAKMLLFKKYQRNSDFAVLNCDDYTFDRLYTLCQKNGLQTIVFGKQECTYSNVKILSIEQRNNVKNRAKFYYQHVCFESKIHNNCGKFCFETDIFGSFQIYNVIESILSCYATFNLQIGKLCNVIPAIKAPPGRMQRFGCTNVFIDYAHTPKSLEEALLLLRSLYKKLVVVFGCGGNRDRQKRPIMFTIAKNIADNVVITTDNPRFEDQDSIINDILCFENKDLQNDLYADNFVISEINKVVLKYNKNANVDVKYSIIEDRRKAIFSAIDSFYGNDTAILIAGKGHEDYQIFGDEKKHFSDIEVVEEYFINKKVS